jgi:queuine tRNA-ribosyltransferase
MDNWMNNNDTLKLPAFFPDATQWVVRGVDGADLELAWTKWVVVNTYHVFRHRKANIIKDVGGIHKFMNRGGTVLSDSWGFQIMSLIRDNPKYGTILDREIIFREDGEKFIFSPEKSIQIQLKLWSNILMSLDDCTRPDDVFEEQEKSVRRTILRAKECREVFDKLTKGKTHKPKLFGIIQGGNDPELRTHCATELIKLGFDGYGYGGYPINTDGELVTDILEHTAKCMPDHLPKYGMGIGRPENIAACYRMWYRLFDCVIPTREARKKKIYSFKPNLEKKDFESKKFYVAYYINEERFFKDTKPLEEGCDCYTCQRYSKAYLYHLFDVNETLAIRLASIHNIRFYNRLIDYLLQFYGP